MAELLDWVVSTACVAHDLHNALHWGLRVVANDEEAVLKKLHIAIESLKNGYNLIHTFLPRFVVERLEFDDGTEHDEDQ
eukprot:72148-Lingulodinium_polyedra.AAC.1